MLSFSLLRPTFFSFIPPSPFSAPTTPTPPPHPPFIYSLLPNTLFLSSFLSTLYLPFSFTPSLPLFPFPSHCLSSLPFCLTPSLPLFPFPSHCLSSLPFCLTPSLPHSLSSLPFSFTPSPPHSLFSLSPLTAALPSLSPSPPHSLTPSLPSLSPSLPHSLSSLPFSLTPSVPHSLSSLPSSTQNFVRVSVSLFTPSYPTCVPSYLTDSSLATGLLSWVMDSATSMYKSLNSNTVEPLNNGYIGDEHFVHCSEVVPSSEIECMDNI